MKYKLLTLFLCILCINNTFASLTTDLDLKSDSLENLHSTDLSISSKKRNENSKKQHIQVITVEGEEPEVKITENEKENKITPEISLSGEKIYKCPNFIKLTNRKH